MGIGMNIKKQRIMKQLTLEELATKVGLTKSTLSKYENGIVTNIPIENIDKIADALNVNPAVLMGWGDLPANAQAVYPSLIVSIPIVASVRAGFGGSAVENREGTEVAYNLKNPGECAYFRVVGDSMAPEIREGDLALVRRQPSVENGELAVVIINGDEGTIKRVQKKDKAVALISFNAKYPPMLYSGQESNEIKIWGKVIEVKRVY